MKDKVETCDALIIHHEIVDKVQRKMPTEDDLTTMAELFKNFSEVTRIKILFALSLSEMCVCDLAALLDMTSSAISHQLRVLKQAQLVKNRREGKVVYYSLKDGQVKKILAASIK